MKAPGATQAAVLVPLFGHPGQSGLVFTERRSDLRRHPGEISFPGGRRDGPAEDLMTTALREAEEEIGLDPGEVELVGALPPVGTFVTGYKVHPFVGLIPAGLPIRSPTEVVGEPDLGRERICARAPGSPRSPARLTARGRPTSRCARGRLGAAGAAAAARVVRRARLADPAPQA